MSVCLSSILKYFSLHPKKQRPSITSRDKIPLTKPTAASNAIRNALRKVGSLEDSADFERRSSGGLCLFCNNFYETDFKFEFRI